jgi:hypothetical protein
MQVLKPKALPIEPLSFSPGVNALIWRAVLKMVDRFAEYEGSLLANLLRWPFRPYRAGVARHRCTMQWTTFPRSIQA